MKLSQLLKPYKPKKPKKVPDPWFFGWWGGSSPPPEGSDGGGMSEALEYRKVHTVEDLPKRVHIDKSFYMELHGRQSTTVPVFYIVKQMLGPLIGAVFLTTSQDEGHWVFAPNVDIFKKGSYNKDDFNVFVSKSQLYNVLKLKWWVKNRLIQLGQLPPIGNSNAN